MLYFAYGSNMSHSQFNERCPTGKFIKRARLYNHQLIFDGTSNWGGAVANIIPFPGGVTWGGLFEIDNRCLKLLDKYEGHPQSYNRQNFVVVDDVESPIEALAYFRNNREIGLPTHPYLERIITGARDCQLPKEYVTHLEKIKTKKTNKAV